MTRHSLSKTLSKNGKYIYICCVQVTYRFMMSMKSREMSRKARVPIRIVMKYSSSQTRFFSVKSKVKPPLVMSGALRNLAILPTLAVGMQLVRREMRERATGGIKKKLLNEADRPYPRSSRKLARRTRARIASSCRSRLAARR